MVRLKHKYGVRVRKQDEALAWSKLRPGVDFVDMNIQRIYELFPLPHGTQRQAITQILKDWSWQARVLQPGKGNYHHMAWRVGSTDPPPAAILSAFGADVIITAVKDLQTQSQQPQIYATVKTQKQLRGQPASSSGAKSAMATDPWIDADPWGGYQKTTSAAAPKAASTTYRAELQDQLRADIRTAIKEERAKQADDMVLDCHSNYDTATELRFVALESGITELKQQNGQFVQWFQQSHEKQQQTDGMIHEVQEHVQQHSGALQHLSTSMQNTEKAIGEVHNTLNVHQQELHSIGANFKTGMNKMKDEITDGLMQSFDQQFGKLEALLEKRQKSS